MTNQHISLNASPVLQERLGAGFARALSLGSQQLPADVSERLRFAREKALDAARGVRAAKPALAAAGAGAIVGVTARGAALMGSPVPLWQRAMSLLPLLLLLAGLVGIDRWSVAEQVQSAADIDAQLLADDLPPAAYSDPGFAEYLRSAPDR
jgi:hypothetical protein